MASNQKTLTERFEAKFVKIEGCWNWFAARNTSGYGKINIKGVRCVEAHRISWQMYVGPIPEGLCVLHKCDNRLCVNPAHLFLGTRLDNSRDMTAKGRNGPCVHRGSEHGMALVTEDDVREMRRLYAEGTLTYSQIGARFGVGKHVAYSAIRRHSWRHVP